MPRMEHRVAPPSSAPPPSQPTGLPLQPANKLQNSPPVNGMGDKDGKDPAAVKKSGKTKRSSKDKESSKDKASKGSRSSSSRRKQQAGAGAGDGGEVMLIDLDDFGLGGPVTTASSASSSAPAPKPRRDSAETRQLKETAMDLLNFGDPIVVSDTSRSAGGRPSEPTASSLSGGFDILGLDSPSVRGTGATARQSKSSSSSSAAVSKKPSSSSLRQKSTTSSSFSSNGGSGAAGASSMSAVGNDAEAAGGGGSSASSSSFKALRFPLLKNRSMKVEYSLAINHAQRVVTVQFRVKNSASGKTRKPDHGTGLPYNLAYEGLGSACRGLSGLGLWVCLSPGWSQSRSRTCR